jgi:hypothetical protein
VALCQTAGVVVPLETTSRHLSVTPAFDDLPDHNLFWSQQDPEESAQMSVKDVLGLMVGITAGNVRPSPKELTTAQ